MEMGIIRLTVKHVIIRPTLTHMIKLYQRMLYVETTIVHLSLKT